MILVRRPNKVITPELSSVDMSLTYVFDTTFQLRELQASPNGVACPYWHPSFGWLKNSAAGREKRILKEVESTNTPHFLVA